VLSLVAHLRGFLSMVLLSSRIRIGVLLAILTSSCLGWNVSQLATAADKESFVKGAPLKKHDWLDIGGQIRFRGEYRENYDLASPNNTLPDDDEFVLSRFRLWTRLTPSPSCKAFLELQSAWVWESETIDTDLPSVGGGNIFQDRIDLQQAYVDIFPCKERVPLYMRLGRQNFDYGQQRLIGSFEWANIGRSFDAVRLRYDDQAWWADAFIAQVVVHDDNRLNDTDNDLPNAADDSTFYSIYGGCRGLRLGDVELSWILRDNDNADDREIHTFGTRFEGKYAQWDYDGEFAYQSGDWTNRIDHHAFAVHLGAGYTLTQITSKPRVGAQYNFATGDDDPDDNDHETFDNLFPTNHPHYGYMDFFSWQNMHNLQLEFQIDPVERLWIKTHLHFFWIHRDDDQWYNAGGGATAGIGPSANRDAGNCIGEELDFVINYVFNVPCLDSLLSLQCGYSHFWAEDFVKDTFGENSDADFVYIQTIINF